MHLLFAELFFWVQKTNFGRVCLEFVTKFWEEDWAVVYIMVLCAFSGFVALTSIIYTFFIIMF